MYGSSQISLTKTFGAPSSNGDQKIWTFSGWVKRLSFKTILSDNGILSSYYGGTDNDILL
jgi:hypothetical protein